MGLMSCKEGGVNQAAEMLQLLCKKKNLPTSLLQPGTDGTNERKSEWITLKAQLSEAAQQHMGKNKRKLH